MKLGSSKHEEQTERLIRRFLQTTNALKAGRTQYINVKLHQYIYIHATIL